MKRMKSNQSIRRYFFCFGWLFLLAIGSGCPTISPRPEWIDHPAGDPLSKQHVVVVGSSSFLPGVPESEIRKDAEVDGRKKLAAFLGIRIQSIARDYSQIVGDLKDSQSIVSLVESQELRQIVIQQTVRLSFVREFYPDREEKTLYCLMTLEEKNFRRTFMQTLEKNLPKSHEPLSKDRQKAMKKLKDLVSKK